MQRQTKRSSNQGQIENSILLPSLWEGNLLNQSFLSFLRDLGVNARAGIIHRSRSGF